MALCPVWVEKVFKTKQGVGAAQQIVPKKKVAICGRKVEIYVRAFYKELHPYRQKEGKFDDLFGVCCGHGPKLMDVAAWEGMKHDWHRGVLSGLRGIVERVEMVPMSEGDLAALAKQDEMLRLMAMCKQDFKRKMNQTNVAKLTVDHWRQVFEECIEEFVAEQVMES